MFFGIGYDFLILNGLGVFWRRIWIAFGMHDGGAGRQNVLFLGLGQCSRAYCLMGGLQGCFWVVFGTTSGCLEWHFF